MANDKSGSQAAASVTASSQDAILIAAAADAATAQVANAGQAAGVTIVKATSGQTVSVACKLPNGLHLDIVATPGLPVRRVSVRGSNAGAVGMNGQRAFPDAIAVAGFGVTPGVPKQFWEEWLRLNQHTAVVQKGLIFAYEQVESTISRAKELGKLTTGLEGLDRDKPGLGIDSKNARLQPFDNKEPSVLSG